MGWVLALGNLRERLCSLNSEGFMALATPVSRECLAVGVERFRLTREEFPPMLVLIIL